MPSDGEREPKLKLKALSKKRVSMRVTEPKEPKKPCTGRGGTLEEAGREALSWHKYSAEGLDVGYCRFLRKDLADRVFVELEKAITYFTGELARVRVFGKWHDIPRQQCAFGEPGLQYTFSGRTVPALPWPDAVRALKEAVETAANTKFNFVLVNRYRSGADHMGEHRDDEAELDPEAPIASVSLGQARDFILRHKDAKKPRPLKRDIAPVKLTLEHGSLLLMNPPTNHVWYHSLPARRSCPGVRVNLTFRRMRLQR